MIEIEHLNKTYPSPGGDIHALRDVNLRIEDGEIFGIIGLSGAGKSTLVRCINLLERPTSGTVRIDGRDMTQLSRRDLLKARQDIGMIFQSFNLLEQRTVLRNICFPLEIAGVKRDEAQARAAELLELVGLSDRAKNYPSQLSGARSSAWPSPAPSPRGRNTSCATRPPAPSTRTPRSRFSTCSRRSTRRSA